MVPNSRQRNPVEKASQGSLLVLLNLTLKLLGFNSDFMFKKKIFSTKKNLKQAYVRNSHKQYVGGRTMNALGGIMEDKGIGIEIIVQFEDFPQIFPTGRDSANGIYVVQCEVCRMSKSVQYKSYYQHNKSPIPYW
jgi:hypothetical protein